MVNVSVTNRGGQTAPAVIVQLLAGTQQIGTQSVGP